jgi:hypothetical protein
MTNYRFAQSDSPQQQEKTITNEEKQRRKRQLQEVSDRRAVILKNYTETFWVILEISNVVTSLALSSSILRPFCHMTKEQAL